MSQNIISFDAAGTLIQVAKPVGQTYAELAKHHGVQVSEEALKRAFRSVWGRLPTPLRPEGVMADDDERSWWWSLALQVFEVALGDTLPLKMFYPLFDDLYHHFAKPEAWIVYDDVEPVLKELIQDHRLCVLSNFDRRLLGLLEGHGIRHYFEHVILSSEVGASKPHPRMFDTVMRVMNVGSECIWHVGDDLRCDIEGAQAMGWQSFAVERPGNDLWRLLEKVREK